MRKNVKVLVTLFLSAMIFVVFCTSISAIEWSSFQRDESRNGFTSETIQLPLKLSHEINIGDELSGGILANGNTIFFTTKNGYIGACNTFLGTIIWKRNLNESITSCAVLSQNDIYIITLTGNLYCISQKLGSILWKTALNNKVSAPLLLAGQNIYVASEDGKIICLQRKDGTMQWTVNLNEPIDSGICYKNFNLYTVTSKGKIVCMDGLSGNIIWSASTEAPSHCPPVAGTESIYVGDDLGNLYCYDHYSDKLYWSKKQTTGFRSSMAFAHFDKRVLVAGLDDKYIGIITGNGNEMWSYASDNTSVSPVSSGRQVFLQGSNQNLVVLDSFDGKVLFQYQLHATVSTGLSIGNGKLFLGTDTGKIMIFMSDFNDYQIELTPDIRTISPGEKTQYEIAIETTEFFNNSINFSVSGFPCSCKGVNRYFDEQGVASTKKVNLVIETSVEATEGRYQFTVTGMTDTHITRVAYGILEITKNKQNTMLQIEKPKTDVKSGQDFVIDVLLLEGKNIRSVSFTLDYPKESLYLRDVTIGSYFKGNPQNQLFDKWVDHEKGRLTVGFSQKGAGESGSGVIASIVFRSLKSGTIVLRCSQVAARDTFLQDLLIIPSDLELTISKGLLKKLVMTINKKVIIINEKAFPLDAPPVIENGRTLAPLRVIAENLESSISWDNKEQKITILQFNKRIELWINRPVCFVNGTEKPMPSNVPPRIIFNRTYVPLRFVADELGADIQWNAKTQTVTILYPK